MLILAGFTSGANKTLLAEVANTANLLYNIMIPAKVEKSPYEHIHKRVSSRLKKLIEFGRIRYVAVRAKLKKKIALKVYKAIMVGYASQHSSDTHRMYNPATRKVFLSRDIV